MCARGVEVQKQEHGFDYKSSILVWSAAIAVIVFLFAYFIYPLPQQREKIAFQQQQEQQQKEKLAKEEIRKINEKNENDILTADSDVIRKLINECRSKISEKLTASSEFGFYFTSYSEQDLTKFANMGKSLGMKLGRPSVALDNHDFNAVETNVANILRKEYPSRFVSFVVEGAHDGFSKKQYAAVYNCHLKGLTIDEPWRSEIHYTN